MPTPSSHRVPLTTRRIHIIVRGAVQGVGFRPFVFRLATELGLRGRVQNSPQGVLIDAEGAKDTLDTLLLRLNKEKPPLSFIQSLEYSFLDPAGDATFTIVESNHAGGATALVLPDIATCAECRADIADPANRRYRYPFTNCTHCGPRFSIMESIPYDRANTSMRRFLMCDDCRREYHDPRDRRFHAQPNACPRCGPHLELWSHDGTVRATLYDALLEAAELLRLGDIVAGKGLGGFHLMVDARNEDAVQRLRKRKHREEKPLAVMVPDLAAAKRMCSVSSLEERLLTSPESPLVLLERLVHPADPTVAASIAPSNPYLGVMLPYTPVHLLLMQELGIPLVATSGNISDEPICTDEFEALRRLGGIADVFLVHNRPIVRHVDDSIVRVMLGRELVLRRARGYAPLPVTCSNSGDINTAPEILAVGAHLKNVIAVARGNDVFLSQHIGDLETEQSLRAFQDTIASLSSLLAMKPGQVVSDLHPEYLSTKYAPSLGAPVIRVQHHAAHVAACMAENELQGQVLGVAWDGTGYGTDGTIWGGEFLLADAGSFRRVATLRSFGLPGGERSIKEPRRTALGVLFEIFGEEMFRRNDLPPLKAFDPAELTLLHRMLEQGINAPITSSAGRLFDGVASLIDMKHRNNYEGQAAMEMEFAVAHGTTDDSYRFRVTPSGVREPEATDPITILDWGPLIEQIIEDMSQGVPKGIICAKFHNSLAEMIVAVARQVGTIKVALSGGCFQNRYLTERAIRRLEAEGFRPYWHQRVPPNDGGIALGQIVAARMMWQASPAQNREKPT